MSRLRAGAKRLLDGAPAPLDAAVSLEVSASLSSPALSMRGTFALAGDPGKLGEVTVHRGTHRLFSGRCDRQRLTLDAAGVLLELEARSAGALLLDNEAQPCALANVRLDTVHALFAAPRGFSLYNPNPPFQMALYTVRSGVSEWEALCGFCRRAWGITPYVQGPQIVVDRPRPAGEILIGNGGEGHPFTRLEQDYRPCRILSQVVMRDALGNYGTAVENPSASWHGVQRTRFTVTPGEFEDRPALDANQRIRRSMLESEETWVTLPGLVDLAPGQSVRIKDAAAELYNLLAEEVVWRQDSAGYITRLRLVSSVYYG